MKATATAQAAIAWLMLSLATGAAASADSGLLRKLSLGPPPTGGQLRLNQQRSGLSEHSFPASPKVVWRGQIPSGVKHSPVVDQQGRLVATTPTGQLVQLDRRGRVDWWLPLGAPAAAAPVVRNDGLRVVVTLTGQLFAVAPEGDVRFVSELSEPIGEQVNLLSLADGTLALSTGRRLLRIGRSGSVRARLSVNEPIRATLGSAGSLLIVGQSGSVFAYDDQVAPRWLGRWDALTQTPALSKNGRLIWVNEGRLHELSLKSARLRRWPTPSATQLTGPVALLADGRAVIRAAAGGLVIAAESGEVQVIPISGESSGGSNPTAPIVDRDGKIAVESSGELIVVGADGSRGAVSGAISRCITTAGVLPLGDGRLSLICGSGSVTALEDADLFTKPRERAY